MDTVVRRCLRSTFGSDSFDIFEYPANLVQVSFDLIAAIDREAMFNPPKQKVLDMILGWLHDNKIKNIRIQDSPDNFLIGLDSLRSWDKNLKQDRIWSKKTWSELIYKVETEL
jgi:hypothetical protein